MLSIAHHKEKLLRALRAATGQAHEEFAAIHQNLVTNEEAAHDYENGYDHHAPATDIDHDTDHYIAALTREIMQAKSADSLDDAIYKITKKALSASFFGQQDHLVYGEYVLFLRDFHQQYLAILKEEQDQTDVNSEAPHAQALLEQGEDRLVNLLDNHAHYGEAGLDMLSYVSNFVDLLNPMEMDEKTRPNTLAGLGIESFMKEAGITPDETNQTPLTATQQESLSNHVYGSYLKIVEPYVSSRFGSRLKPEYMLLIGHAVDGIVHHRHGAGTVVTGEMLKDESIIDAAAELLQPVLEKHLNLGENKEDFLRAYAMLEHEIGSLDERSRAAALAAEQKVVNLFGARDGRA